MVFQWFSYEKKTINMFQTTKHGHDFDQKIRGLRGLRRTSHNRLWLANGAGAWGTHLLRDDCIIYIYIYLHIKHINMYI